MVSVRILIFAFSNGIYMDNGEIGSISVSHSLPSGWYGGGRLLDCGEIVAVDGGCVELRINRDTHHLQSGTLAVLFPGDVISAATPENEPSLRRLSFSFSILREAFLQVDFAAFVSVRRNLAVTSRPVFFKVARAVIDVTECVAGGADCRVADKVAILQLQSLFACIADCAAREFPMISPFEEGSYRTSRLFSKFMELLEIHYKESHEVRFYADLLRITPKYLTAVCTKVTGQSAKALINNFLTIKLKLALRNTEASVKEISAAHSFPTVSYFCQYFKQNAGMPPQEYRQWKWQKK